MKPAVFLITDPRWSLARIEEVIESAAVALGPGMLGVQLRDKAASSSELAASAARLRDVTQRVGALFVVNAATGSSIDVAARAGADGVHVPCRAESIGHARKVLGSRVWLSTPAHSDADVSHAVDSGATAALVSPIFDSPGKGSPRGVEALATARARASGLAVIALGGIDASNVAACSTAGANGVAVIRALLDASDVGATARALVAPFRSCR